MKRKDTNGCKETRNQKAEVNLQIREPCLSESWNNNGDAKLRRDYTPSFFVSMGWVAWVHT